MSRFDMDDDGDGLPFALWQSNVSRALGGRRGQDALAAMEAALLQLPERKLVDGHLAAGGSVCAVGAFVAHREAQERGVDIATVIEAMSAKVRCWCDHGRDAHEGGRCTGKRWGGESCTCTSYDPDGMEDAFETAEAGRNAGLTWTLAWHLAYLNDEHFEGLEPEERYDRMLAWVRRAQGKEAVAA